MVCAEEDASVDHRAASEAITAEMNMAMLQYMPLRGILSFGGGQVELPPAVRGLLGMPAEEE